MKKRRANIVNAIETNDDTLNNLKELRKIVSKLKG
jgi:hypothetical protein